MRKTDPSEVENGLTNKQIADELRVKEKSIKDYMTSIMHKYGIHNRVAAVLAHRVRVFLRKRAAVTRVPELRLNGRS